MAKDRDDKFPRYVRKPARAPRAQERETWALKLVLDGLRGERDALRAAPWLRALEPYVDDPADFAHRVPEEHRAAFLAQYDGSEQAFPPQGSSVAFLLDELIAEADVNKATALVHDLATFAVATGIDCASLEARLPTGHREIFCAEYAALR